MRSIAAKEEENLLGAAFKAVIIYDDIGSAARATALLERVAAQTDAARKWDIKSWRLGALKEPALATVTLAVGADADLVVLALSQTSPPTEELLDWLKRWAGNRQIENAAIALLGPETDAALPLRNELERFARRRGLAFFGAPEAWQGEVSPGIRRQPRREPPFARELRPFAEPASASSHRGVND